MVATDAAADGFIFASSLVALGFAVFQFFLVAKVRGRHPCGAAAPPSSAGWATR